MAAGSSLRDPLRRCYTFDPHASRSGAAGHGPQAMGGFGPRATSPRDNLEMRLPPTGAPAPLLRPKARPQDGVVQALDGPECRSVHRLLSPSLTVSETPEGREGTWR